MKAVFPKYLSGHATDEPGRFPNFHVVCHCPEQVEWFGSLLIMSSARWESTHTNLKRLYRQTRRNTQGLCAAIHRARQNQEKEALLISMTHAADGESDGSDDDDDAEMDDDHDDEPAVDARRWTAVSKVTSIIVQESNLKAIAKFTVSEDIARTFIRSTFPTFQRAVEGPSATATTTIGVIKAASFTASEDGADDEERLQLRGDPDYRGAPWHMMTWWC